MRAMTRLLVGAGGVVLLAASAIGQETEFVRKRTSAATAKADSAQCWRHARKAKLTEEQATQNLAVGYLVGGIVGVLITASENEDANKSPKSSFRRQVHDDCMERRGYKRTE